MVAVLILFLLFAGILLFGMIGDKDAQNRKNYTRGFCIIVAAVTIILMLLI